MDEPSLYLKLPTHQLENGMNFNLKEVERLHIHDLRISLIGGVDVGMGMLFYELRFVSF
jgi:hypothetical protein